MKKITVFILFLLVSAVTFAQTEIEKVAKARDMSGVTNKPDSLKAWFLNGTGTITFSQASFSNWGAGGQNSLGLDVFANLKANYRKGKHSWSNTLDMGYGFQLLTIDDNAEFRKTNDKLELTSAYGYMISKNKLWCVTALVNFKTQFDRGYKYPDDSNYISKFMAPGYVIAGVGITYNPSKWVYLYLSPASARMTLVLDDTLSAQGQFGVDPGDHLRTEFGPYFRADMNKDLAPNINLASTLELTSDYLNHFGNIDVNWNVLLTMKVNKWLAASITTQLIYDDNINIRNSETGKAGPKTQFKEILGIGLSYMVK